MQRKVQAGGLGGAIGIIVVWAISEIGADVPGEVAAAIAMVLGVVVGWLVPERS